MAKWVVATVDEIPPGARKIVDVGGRSIGVFNVGGEFFALLNRCPHQGGPLCLGNTLGFLRSDGCRRVRLQPRRRDPALPVARLGVRPAHRPVVVRPGRAWWSAATRSIVPASSCKKARTWPRRTRSRSSSSTCWSKSAASDCWSCPDRLLSSDHGRWPPPADEQDVA